MGGAASATSTDETETSVGRVAIQDDGYLDSGAEHRGGEENDRGPMPDVVDCKWPLRELLYGGVAVLNRSRTIDARG
jgi:hypothetical protein